MYGAEANGEPCVIAALAKGEDAEMVLGAEQEAANDGGRVVADVGTVPREREDGRSDTKLEERRERVPCVGGDDDVCGGGGGGEEDRGRDVIDPVGDDIDGGDAVPLRRGGRGVRDLLRLFLLCDRTMIFVLESSDMMASAISSCFVVGGGDWVLSEVFKKYSGSS